MRRAVVVSVTSDDDDHTGKDIIPLSVYVQIGMFQCWITACGSSVAQRRLWRSHNNNRSIVRKIIAALFDETSIADVQGPPAACSTKHGIAQGLKSPTSAKEDAARAHQSHHRASSTPTGRGPGAAPSLHHANKVAWYPVSRVQSIKSVLDCGERRECWTSSRPSYC